MRKKYIKPQVNLNTEVWKTYTTIQRKTKTVRIDVSNFGNVRVNGIDYKFSGKSAYPQLYLLYVHRMVAELFIPNPYNKPQVDHIDTNPYNNHVNNLRWVTQSENNYNSITNKRMHDKEANPEFKTNRRLKAKQYYKDHPEARIHLSKTISDMKFRWMTDGVSKPALVPMTRWGEYIDIGYHFGKRSTYNKNKQ